MTVPHLDGSIEALTLPHENALEHAQLFQEWNASCPYPTPIERGLIHQAAVALIEKRRIERTRATLRTQKVRTALLNWEQDQEDTVAYWVGQFGNHAPSALVGLLRSAAGCRWAIDYWTKLAQQLEDDGTWYGEFRIGAIQLQGQSAYLDKLFVSETAYYTWLDCLGAQPNPKQRDIDLILDWRHIPKTIQDRDIVLWPRDREACRARLQAIVDRELPRLKALEETLRVDYEEPAKAEARVMALAAVDKEEMKLIRAQRLHEQSFVQAATALTKLRNQTAALRPAPAAREIPVARLLVIPLAGLVRTDHPAGQPPEGTLRRPPG
jgi:hypothetical protein